MHHSVTEMCTHVHISVTKCCIVGYGTDAFWDLWNGCIWMWRCLFIGPSRMTRSLLPLWPWWIEPRPWLGCDFHEWLNSSSPGQIGRHFADDIFRCIFGNEKFCILIKISLKFVPKSLIDNIPALVYIMAWWFGTNAYLIHWRIYAALRGGGGGHRSASRLAFGALEPYRHYGIGTMKNRHWRCSVASDEGPRLGASGHTHDDVAYAPKSVLDIWQDAGTDIQQPEVGL